MGEVFSSNYSRWLERDRLQPAVSLQREPGLIYIPPGTWEEGIIVGQHNLTLVGAGEESVIVGDEQPAITVLAPNIRIINLSVRTEDEHPAIAFMHGDAPQCVLQNVTVLESGHHGVFRDNDYGSAVNAIIDCEFRDISGDAIHVQSGSGPQNLVRGNRAEDVNGDFIRWGVDASLLLDNRCEDAAIHLTSDSDNNFAERNGITELINESETNVITD